LSRSRASGGASPESIHGTLVTFNCAIALFLLGMTSPRRGQRS
jgi:hypothetical protein